jgi:hypothetical protein
MKDEAGQRSSSFIPYPSSLTRKPILEADRKLIDHRCPVHRQLHFDTHGNRRVGEIKAGSTKNAVVCVYPDRCVPHIDSV